MIEFPIRKNMLVMAQIESKTAYGNLDSILAVKGLSAITGGPHDFAASIGFPGQPNHPDRQKLTTDAEDRARKAGKWASSDLMTGIGLQELVLTRGREFVTKNAGVKLGA